MISKSSCQLGIEETEIDELSTESPSTEKEKSVVIFRLENSLKKLRALIG